MVTGSHLLTPNELAMLQVEAITDEDRAQALAHHEALTTLGLPLVTVPLLRFILAQRTPRHGE